MTHGREWIGCFKDLTVATHEVFHTFSVAILSLFPFVTIYYSLTLSLVCYLFASNMQFSTKDEDNDGSASSSCAPDHHGAWWFAACHHSNLNGLYHSSSYHSNADGIIWYTFEGHQYSLKRTEMKVKTKV